MYHVNASTTYNLLYTCISTAALSVRSEPREDYDVALLANDHQAALNFLCSGSFKCCTKRYWQQEMCTLCVLSPLLLNKYEKAAAPA